MQKPSRLQSAHKTFTRTVALLEAAAALATMVCLLNGVAFSQTPSALLNVAQEKKAGEVSAQSVAPNNPWIPGAQVGLKFAGTGSISDALLVNASAAYFVPLDPISSHGWALPVMGNLASLASDLSGSKTLKDSLDKAAKTLLSSAEGINVSLYPYRVVRNKTNTSATLFGAIGAKVNNLPSKDKPSDAVTLLQGRFAVGLELAIGKPQENSTPRQLTISLAGVGHLVGANAYKKVFGEDQSFLASTELTTIVPIQPGMAVLMEMISCNKNVPAWRLALLFTRTQKQ